jgi:hypothetical protein
MPPGNQAEQAIIFELLNAHGFGTRNQREIVGQVHSFAILF